MRNFSFDVPIMDPIDPIHGPAFALDASATPKSGVLDEQSDFRTLLPRASTIARCWVNRRRATQIPGDM